jgi:polar amino acid transport system substrate-binding protein
MQSTQTPRRPGVSRHRNWRTPWLLAVTSSILMLAAACSSTSSSTSSSQASPSASSSGQESALRAMLPSDIRQANAMTVATDATYPPCEYIQNNTTTMVGFEPDLWNALGRLYGIKVNTINTNLDGLIPGVQSGRYQFAMECLSDLVPRESAVTFIDFALDGTSSVTLASNSYHITTNPLSICGLTVALQAGNNLIGSVQSAVDPYCQKNGKPPVHLQVYPTNSAALLAVYSGRADMTMQDTDSASFLEVQAPKPVVAIANLNGLVPPSYIGIVVGKGDSQFTNALLAGLTALYKDGRYQAIMAKWKVPSTDWIAPGVDLQKTKPINATL